MADRARAIGAMGRAETMLGQQGMADALGVTKRSVRYYLSADREISPTAMVLTAAALDAKCSAMAEQAAQLRALAEVGDAR